MPRSEADLRTAIDRHGVRIAEEQRHLASGAVPTERLPGVVHGLGRGHDALARAHALLGERDDARTAYAHAAVYYLSSVRESRARRDMLSPRERYDDPATCVHAIGRGLLADDDRLARCVARETLSMGERFLLEHDNRSYYGAKLLAAVVAEEDHARFAEEYRHSFRMDAASVDEYRLMAYEGIAEGDAARTARGLEGLLDHAEAIRAAADVGPERAVDDWLAALVALARDRGIDVTVDAPTVPDALVPDPGDETRVVRAEADEADHPTGDDAGAPGEFPRIDRDAGTYVLVDRVEVPDDGVVTGDDLEWNDEWVAATVDRLAESDDDTQRERARAVGDDEPLRGRLVVAPGRDGPDRVRVEASVFDLVDDLEVER